MSLEIKMALAKTQQNTPESTSPASLGCRDVLLRSRGGTGISCGLSTLTSQLRAVLLARREGQRDEGRGRVRKKVATVVWETQGQQQHPLQTLSSCKFIFIVLVVLLKGGEIHSASLSFVSYWNIFHQHFQCPLPL